jgi:uncharacterized protein YjbJ (UPF0337 family)
MSIGDKLKHKMEELQGKAKRKGGAASGDRSMESEGRFDESKADLKQAGDKAKDAFDK